MKKLNKILLLIAIAISTFAVEEVQATHFRYGTLSWTPSGPAGQVVFTFKAAFRRSAYGTPVNGSIITETVGATGLNFGDATSTGTLNFLVTSYSVTEDWIIGEALQPSTTNVGIPHTYAGAGPYTASVDGCCRVSNLNLGGDQGYRMETTVTPLNGNISPTTNQSPILNVAVGSSATFMITGSDANGDVLRYRLSTPAEKGFTGNPPLLSIDNITGLVTWNNIGLNQVNFWTVQFMIEDLDGLGNIKSKTPVDILLKLVTVVGTPPSCALSTGGSPITTICLSPITFDITATDPDAGAVISINASGLPAGATMSPSLPTSGSSPVSSTFNWSPTGAQLGSYNIVFTLTDENNQQSQCTQQINVGVKSITPIGPTTICTGSSVLLTVSPPGTTYLWSNGATTQSVSASVAGMYSVTVDGISSCNQSEVIVNSVIPTITANGPTTICSGGSVVLTASTAGPWLWNNGATTQSITISAIGTVTRTVTVNACTSAPETVTVNALPGTFTASSVPVCEGSTLNLTATNSSGAISYSWTGSNSFTSPVQNPSIPSVTAAASGAYTVGATNAIGCTRSVTITVNLLPGPVITPSNNGPICTGSSVTLNASATGNFISTYNVSSIPHSPAACLGNAGPSGDDVVSGVLNIGFSFNFFSTNYTTFGISTNGNIQLGSGAYSTSFTPAVIPTAAAPNNFIGVPWCDLLPTAGQITWGSTGVSPNRKLIVCFNNVPFYSGGGVFSSQIILYEGSNFIEMHTSVVSNTTSSKAMGIENSTGTLGVAPPGRNLGAWSITAPEAWRFTPTVNQLFTWSSAVACQNANCSVATDSPSSTTVYTVSVTTSNGCSGTASTTVNVAQPPSTADAGTDQTVQGYNTATMAGNAPSIGSGLWSVISGSGTFADASNPASGVTGMTAGSNVFRWTISNAPCADAYDEMEVFFIPCTDPAITCPADISVLASASGCGANVTWADATVTGIPTPTITYSPANGSFFPLGTTTVTATATNICGTATCTFTVTVSSTLSVSAGNDESTYFGYTGDQTVVRTAAASGGTGPYSYSWTMDRPLKCNEFTAAGDEIFSGGTCTNTVCPSTGALTLIPVCSGNATVTVRLMDTTNVCVTVTDAFGCTATDCFTVMAQDARCFAGNSNNAKVKVCHATGSSSNPWVQICIANEAVPAHLANNTGDYVGNCSNVRLASGSENDAVSYINLFPNPAHQSVNVSFVCDNENIYQIQLLDVTGRVVKSYNGVSHIGENEQLLNLSDIANGMYQVLFIMDDKKEVKKLVVE